MSTVKWLVSTVRRLPAFLVLYPICCIVMCAILTAIRLVSNMMFRGIAVCCVPMGVIVVREWSVLLVLATIRLREGQGSVSRHVC